MNTSASLYSSVLEQIVTYVSAACDPTSNSSQAISFAEKSVAVLLTVFVEKCPVAVQAQTGLIELIIS